VKVINNYIATSNTMKLVYWPSMGRLLHVVQREGKGKGKGKCIYIARFL